MKKTDVCLNCQYSREPGPLDLDIPGVGNWCSNAQSPRWRTRVAANDSCPMFYQRGKKAPASLRFKIWALGWFNKLLAWFLALRKKK